MKFHLLSDHRAMSRHGLSGDFLEGPDRSGLFWLFLLILGFYTRSLFVLKGYPALNGDEGMVQLYLHDFGDSLTRSDWLTGYIPFRGLRAWVGSWSWHLTSGWFCGLALTAVLFHLGSAVLWVAAVHRKISPGAAVAAGILFPSSIVKCTT
jgi:hypothetical protein